MGSRFVSRRRSVGLSFALSLLVVLVSGSTAGVAQARSGCWTMPVDGVVVDVFRPPACRWCAGNRGLEFSTPLGSPVRAVADGRVTYVGSVAGRDHVVIALDGAPGLWRVTFAGTRGSGLSRGDRVSAGDRLGVTTGVFHLGWRVGSLYVDPTRMLRFGHLRASLLAPGEPAPRPAPCPGSAGVFPGARR